MTQASVTVARGLGSAPPVGQQHSAGEPVRYRLEPFGEGSAADRGGDLALLHRALLGHSPVSLLGMDFMSKFYYRALPQLNLIFGHVAYVDDEPAGFIVATHDSSGFMQQAIRRRPLSLLAVMAWSVLRDPTRIGAIWEAFQIMRGLPAPVSGDAAGELLSFGVLPRFRTRDFVARHRLKIGQDLLEAALKQVTRRNVRTVRVIVDADNLEARMFYLGNGWVPGRDEVPGWRKRTVEFIWSAG